MVLISILVPAYNEEKQLKKTIIELMHVLHRLNYEIIIINDGSTDNTLSIAKNLCKFSKNIKLISYSPNRGKGFALKKGFLISQGDYIVFFDSDLDIPPNQILGFLKLLKKKCDIVIGSKYLPGSEIKYSKRRKLLSNIYRHIVKFLFRLDLTDTQVGLKIFKRSVLKKVFPKLSIKKYAFDVELLIIAHKFGFRICEAPVKIVHKSFSSNVDFKAILRMLIDTIAIFYRYSILRYYNGD